MDVFPHGEVYQKWENCTHSSNKLNLPVSRSTFFSLCFLMCITKNKLVLCLVWKEQISVREGWTTWLGDLWEGGVEETATWFAVIGGIQQHNTGLYQVQTGNNRYYLVWKYSVEYCVPQAVQYSTVHNCTALIVNRESQTAQRTGTAVQHSTVQSVRKPIFIR